MTTPPKGRAPVSFQIASSHQAHKEGAKEGDRKDAKAQIRRVAPTLANVLKSAGDAASSRSQALAERAITDRRGTKRKPAPVEGSTEASTGDAAGADNVIEQHKRGRNVPSPLPPLADQSPPTGRSDSKSAPRDMKSDGAAPLDQAKADEILKLSPIEDVRPAGFSRYVLERPATAALTEQISVTVPAGDGALDPFIDKKSALHIILGEQEGMGHLGSVTEPTARKKTNTPFPLSWSADKILLIAWQIAKLHAQELTSERHSSSLSRYCERTVQGVAIRVVVRGNRIITAYPLDARQVRKTNASDEVVGAKKSAQPKLVPRQSAGRQDAPPSRDSK